MPESVPHLDTAPQVFKLELLQEPPLSPRRRATRVSRHELTLNHGTSDSRVLSLCFGGGGGGTVRADKITCELPPLALTK